MLRKGTHSRRFLYTLVILIIALIFGTSVKIDGCCRSGAIVQFMVLLGCFFGNTGVSYLIRNVYGNVYYWRIEAG